MLLSRLSLSLLLVVGARAQVTLTGTATPSTSSSTTNLGDSLPTGTEVTYISYASTRTVSPTSSSSDSRSGTMSDFSTLSAASNTSSTHRTHTSTSVTILSGASHSTTRTLNGTGMHNATASSTSSSALPTNTQPCNGWAEFCARNFSNITYVAAHNSPFILPNNVASNQVLDVTTQLNDGIRMLQFQTHWENNTLYLCHTSCQLLNAGTLENYLVTVRTWLQENPYEVITILMGNDDLIQPGNYTAPFVNAGLMPYIYTPPKIPMAVDDWPVLSSMILQNKRVVVMLDYNANQTAIPWLMDEFGQMWESPFSPTERSFPCTAQRPPDNYAGALPRTNRMYMANHNLNAELNLGSFSLLVPASSVLNETNAVTGYGSLGLMADNCTAMWGRPPNFLLVDYYNDGSFNGSVFQVAADMNNVTYNRNSCCGSQAVRSAASGILLRTGETGLRSLLVSGLVGFVWFVLLA